MKQIMTRAIISIMNSLIESEHITSEYVILIQKYRWDYLTWRLLGYLSADLLEDFSVDFFLLLHRA